MALRKALVVDDSRSARVALKKLLQEHDIEVALSESGEHAIEFLKHESVDVIFMDHTMPGMDGLEAVTAIKANPATATIPVMMYTTREGEVYVGQARALGAVGVMPKNIQPHQLFEMLKNLGLVKERRTRARGSATKVIPDTTAASSPSLEPPVVTDALSTPDLSSDLSNEMREGAHTHSDADSEYHEIPALQSADGQGSEAGGMALESLVSRMLEDQHLTLRSDILRSQRVFAKQVAKEIVLEQARAEESEALVATPLPTTESPRWRSVALAASVVTCVVCGFLAINFKSQRDDAIAQLATSTDAMADATSASLTSLENALDDTANDNANLRERAVQAIAWALNSDNGAGLDEVAFSSAMADKVSLALEHLQAIQFEGVVRLSSHLGKFCLNGDESGVESPIDAGMQVADCTQLGHPLENSTRVSERLSVPFSRLFREYDQGPLRLELVALDGIESEAHVDYPQSSDTVAAWNRVARMNNRVDVQITSDTNLLTADLTR